MIGLLYGIIVEKGSESLVIDTGGVGYEVCVPAGVLLEAGVVGDEIRLRTHLDVKDDALALYGFSTRDQLDMFRLLISVGNVGPRSALAVLSGLDVGMIVHAIQHEQVAVFTRIPGIGKKTGQRILLDLSEKVVKRWGPAGAPPPTTPVAAETPSGQVWDMARDALSAQGFKAPEIENRLAWARKRLGDSSSIRDVVVEALRFRQ